MRKKEIEYLSTEKITEYNFLVLLIIKAKKADQHKVLSSTRLNQIIKGCENTMGDIYDKATFLFKNIIQLHPFASGNRRTAFIATKAFLIKNKRKFNIENDPKQARTMLGIREGYYSDKDIKDWIKNGKIKKFKRFE